MITPNSQAGRLLQYLLSGKKIDRRDSYTVLGIFELSARVIDLEKHGFKINKKTKKVFNRFGEKVTVKEYSLDQSQIAKMKDVQHEAVA